MTMMRLLFGLPGAAIITALLFAFMAMAIKTGEPVIGERPEKIDSVTMAPEKLKSDPDRSKQTIPLEEPAPPEIEFEKKLGLPEGVGTLAGPGPVTPDPGPLVTGGGTVTPTIKIAPQYPEGCRSRGAQGAVLVQFDVAADGSVVNPQIIESANSCFNRTVLRAVSKWKYPPGRKNGKAVMRRGVVERFNFQLSQ